MSSTSTLRERLQNLLSTSNKLGEDLLDLVIEFTQIVHRVDMYNVFNKQLQKTEIKHKTDVYEALANTMDIIWAGNTGQAEIYSTVLTDEDFAAREASRKIFGR